MVAAIFNIIYNATDEHASLCGLDPLVQRFYYAVKANRYRSSVSHASRSASWRNLYRFYLFVVINFLPLLMSLLISVALFLLEVSTTRPNARMNARFHCAVDPLVRRPLLPNTGLIILAFGGHRCFN
jgi:hypothetical protein